MNRAQLEAKIKADIKANIKMGMSQEMAEFVAYANNGKSELIQETVDAIIDEQDIIKIELEKAGFKPFIPENTTGVCLNPNAPKELTN